MDSKRRISIFSLIIISILGILSIQGVKKEDLVALKIDVDTEYQTMHSFGASDAWRCQFVGSNWPEEKRDQIAEWLFSKEVDSNGNPKGIGLSLWRFNIGAGSAELGDSSGITHTWRRAECFLSEYGSYNWNKQQGQQWFLKKAKEYGVDYSLAFTISAPVQMTLNGKAFAQKGRKQFNVAPGKLDNYANFLIDVCEHFKSEGLPFDYLSPFNEPQWDWNGPSQEGTPATNEELYVFTKYLDKEISNRNLNLKLAIGEAADIRFITGSAPGYDGFSNQAHDFFNSNSSLFMGELASVKPLITGHSYFTTWPVDTLIDTRVDLKKSLNMNNSEIDYWQSEFCVLENNDDIGGGWKRDLEMPTALYVARVMHNDITLCNAASWQWWTAISQCDYKDGLIYLDAGDDGINNQDDPNNEKLKYDGNYHDSKLMWALGNYSRFVRPGMKRIMVEQLNNKELKDQATDLMVSGFKDEKSNELVLVFINYGEKDKEIKLDQSMIQKDVKAYVTSDKDNLTYQPMNANRVNVRAKSIMTTVLKLK